MKLRKRILFAAGLAAFGIFAASSHAQVMQLGNVPTDGKVIQASCDCSGGGLLGKFGFGGGCDGGCGAAPSCGMAGTILGGAGCGVPEPSCGSAGLGYGGGFGLCGGGDCGSCGVGGYMGRNLHPVNPCACGGSLLGDVARGVISLVDRTVACVVGSVFGGLRAVTCHASGSFAAIQCAAQAACYSCGGAGCDACGVSEYGMSYDDVNFNYTPTEVLPAQPQPMEATTDPFLDDPPTPNPQARQLRSTVQKATYNQGHRIGSSVQRTLNRVKTATSRAASPLHGRYLQGRGPTLRR